MALISFCALEKRGMSQKEFSEKTGIAQSTISDWKRKKTNPSADKIMIISDVLDVSPFDILQILDFIDNHQIDPSSIRQSVENLSWKVQMKRVLDEV